MRIATFEKLQHLHQRHGPQRFGKIAQKLLLLAFIRAGYTQWVDRGVQGVDFDAANAGGEKYAIEVKTTTGDNVVLSSDNIEALQQRTVDGYTPVIAVLRIGVLGDWQFAALPTDELRPQTLPVRRLLAYPLDNLHEGVRPRFDEVMAEHFQGTLHGGEDYLLRIIGQERTSASGNEPK